jgi:hypothetical protein
MHPHLIFSMPTGDERSSISTFFPTLACTPTRSADVEAKWDSDLYVLSRRRFNECSRMDTAIGVLVFARLAKTIALKLRDTNLVLSD